jgi:3-hydroxyisobutyrate dehydrogenase-like beta-hydroxyacid dehydrogenase
MDIGFIGLGKMGFPMARRLIEAKHQLIVFDQRKDAVDKLVALSAQPASSPKDVATAPKPCWRACRRCWLRSRSQPARAG